MVACLLLQMPWNERGWDDAGAGFDRSKRKLPLKEFLRIVRNGSDDGTMQSWAKLLDEKQITQLYNYVRARADKVLPPGRPDEVGPNGGPWIPPKGWPRQP